tara:strand:+ start:349 stop:1005 length:657 start_codon:yes stop_codon:yes gene_type:complete
MAQHDFIIDNQSASSARADINNALQSLASLSSGDTEPSTTYANMLWYETDTNLLKMRDEANADWITIGYFDQSADAFRILDDTQVVNSSGNQTGLLGGQLRSTWRTGTSTIESLISPFQLAQVVYTNSNIDPGGSTYYDLDFDLTAGLQIRFGYVNKTTDPQTHSFSRAFSNQALAIVVQRETAGNVKIIPVDTLTTSSFRTDSDSVLDPFWYIALGR